mmetsp:Transcript_46772/g.149268  ORF Transcript_46772/g.149268 Transcript_46772/m.149268 type:complete len:315 (+) Transcript_46772:179-1123(+)
MPSNNVETSLLERATLEAACGASFILTFLESEQRSKSSGSMEEEALPHCTPSRQHLQPPAHTLAVANGLQSRQCASHASLALEKRCLPLDQRPQKAIVRARDRSRCLERPQGFCGRPPPLLHPEGCDQGRGPTHALLAVHQRTPTALRGTPQEPGDLAEVLKNVCLRVILEMHIQSNVIILRYDGHGCIDTMSDSFFLKQAHIEGIVQAAKQQRGTQSCNLRISVWPLPVLCQDATARLHLVPLSAVGRRRDHDLARRGAHPEARAHDGAAATSACTALVAISPQHCSTIDQVPTIPLWQVCRDRALLEAEKRT